MKALAACLLLAAGVFAQPPIDVEREFRAVWVATVDNIDFPTKKALSIGEQQAELVGIVDLAKRLRLNAVIFQVRPACDAVYRSDIEPWSEYLTGQMGKAQSFDPLAFLVAEAHRRGVLVHAWFNPFRAYHPSGKTISADHISKRQPQIVRSYGRHLWLDPTESGAKQHSLRVILDVVRRYDVDGVHFDDYFYPYPEKDKAGNNIPFPDDANWEEYRNGGGKMDRGSWRRTHVNTFIESVGREVKKLKPHVMYGISPFGIWQPNAEREIRGFNAYAELYADARKWLRDGTVDYLAPQLYWETGRPGVSFPVLFAWWKEQNVGRGHIWPGLATYRIGSKPEFNADEIADQIRSTREDALTRGAFHFSFRSLRNDLGGIQKKLRDEVYLRDALIPRSPWIRSRKLDSPTVSKTRRAEFVVASWKRQRRAFWYVVYAKDKNGWTYSVLPGAENSIALSAERGIEKIVVTSVDRLGNESR